MLQDTDIFPYGKYNQQGLTMEEVPAWYILGQAKFFSTKQISPGSPIAQVIRYADENEEALKLEMNG